MKNLLLLLIFVCSFNLYAQNTSPITSSEYTIELVTVSPGEFFANKTKNFIDYQTLYLLKESDQITLMNGESFGVPQNPSKNVIVFVGNLLTDKYTISTSLISDQTQILLLDDNDLEISKVKLN